MPSSQPCLIECSDCLMMKEKLIFFRKIPLHVVYKTVKNSQEKYVVCMLRTKERGKNVIL